MANSVNVQMGVSGIAQFQEGMKKAQASVKTLDEALKLNEAQFRQTGDAEEYLSRKADTLKKQIEQQQKVVEQSETALAQMKKNGVDPASSAFQAMETKSLKAKTQLANMQTELANVGKEGEEAGKQAEDLNTKLGNIGNQMSLDTVISGINKITGALETAAKKAFALGEAVVTNTLGAGQWADELMTTATIYGITPEELQRMRKTADLIDTDADTIIKAQSKLKRAMGSEGSQDTMGAFAALGIDPTASHENWEDVFWSAGEALKSWGDEVEQEEYAQRLFGKSWKELLPLFSEGREEYEKMYASWNVVSDSALENLGKLDDQYQKFDNELETLRNEFFAALAPGIEGVLETLTGLMSEFNTYLQTDDGKEMLQAMGDAVSGLFTDLSKIDPQQVMEGFKGVFDSIIDGFKWLQENKQPVITALEAVVGGWAALKITGGALELMKLINGLQWLGSNPHISLPGVGGGAGAGTGATTGTTGTTGITGTTGTTGGGIGLVGAGGLVGTAAIIAGFAAAAKERWTNPLIRGSGLNVAAKAESSGTEDAFIKFVQANQALQEYLDSGAYDEDKITQMIEEINKAQETFHSMEGWAEMMDSYSAWRQENSLGNEDWQLPAELLQNNSGAMDRMTEVAGENAEAIRNLQASSIKASDAEAFGRLPKEIQTAVRNGMQGIVINIDGQRASSVLGPIIGGQMAGTIRAIVK